MCPPSPPHYDLRLLRQAPPPLIKPPALPPLPPPPPPSSSSSATSSSNAANGVTPPPATEAKLLTSRSPDSYTPMETAGGNPQNCVFPPVEGVAGGGTRYGWSDGNLKETSTFNGEVDPEKFPVADLVHV